MDKNWKLQRYNRKDYSELVEFPVEIVGRDGVVRRYTFEDSIRLYQRRITFAPIRYRDDDLVEAEVGHCRSRIVQLRRSYFHRYGWGTPEGEPEPADFFGVLAGEVAAFLCRVLRCDERPDVSFEQLGDEDGLSHWYLRMHPVPAGLLLAVYRFEEAAAEEQREAFFSAVKDLERAGQVVGDGEHLVAFHHTADCGFVLTCRGDLADHVAAWKSDEDDLNSEPTPWDQVVELVRRNQLEEALGRCRSIVEDQPWHRNAYAAGSVLATWLGRPAVGEDMALVGSRYFPDDAVLHYQLGLARARLDRGTEAATALERSVELEPSLTIARLLWVVLLLEAGGFRRARRVLRSRRRHAHPDDRRTDSTLARLHRWIWWRGLTVSAGLFCVVLGAAATLLGGWLGLLPVVLGLSMSWTASALFRRGLDRITDRQRFDDVHHGLRRLSRRTTTTARPSVS